MKKNYKFFNDYKSHFNQTFENINFENLENIILKLIKIRNQGGRIFCIGVGGSAANASHLVNDLRKICNIECYSPSDNVSELSARINDDGWQTSYSEWLKVSKLNKKDAILVLSVGGGNKSKKISMNIVESIKVAQKVGASILGFVGKNGGYTKKVGEKYVVLIKVKNSKLVTPIVEAMQAVLWHYIVSDHRLKKNKTKW
tara:strand:+ start:657 stop:1256 length:600 start_codon:yes stop_codon:yes gene_type:complete